jgi:hypothetical protein
MIRSRLALARTNTNPLVQDAHHAPTAADAFA